MFAWITKRRTEGPYKATRSNPSDGDQFRLEVATTISKRRLVHCSPLLPGVTNANASRAGVAQLVEHCSSTSGVARFESGHPLQRFLRHRTQAGLRAQIATLLFVGSNPTGVSNASLTASGL